MFASIIMATLGVTSIFSVCPLLLFSVSYSKKSYLKIAGVYLLYLVGSAIYLCSGMEHFLCEVAMQLYIPVSLLAAGTIWIFMSQVSWQKRLFYSFLPIFLLTAAFAVYFSVDRALFDSLYQSYENVFVDLLESYKTYMPIAMDGKVLFGIFAIVCGILVLPLMLAAVCTSCFLYENKKYSKEGCLEEKVVDIEINQNFIWFFLVSFAFFLMSYLVSMPMVCDIAAESIFLSACLIYMIQGFSVLFAWIRKVAEKARCSSLLGILVFMVLFVPGLSIFVLLGLLILGVLENFFNLKIRREK